MIFPSPKCRLVAWTQIYKSKDQGGWGILHLADFNQALSGKWWGKFSISNNPCWSEIIAFNYAPSGGSIDLFHATPRIKSFFWKGLLNCREGFLSAVEVSIKDGRDTSLWLDCWMGGPRWRTDGLTFSPSGGILLAQWPTSFFQNQTRFWWSSSLETTSN